MKDFDNIFNDRLNEEGQFPNQRKNWDKLSDRLDVAAGMLAAAKALLLWKITAVCLLVVSGILLWKVCAVQKENKQLEQTVAALQTRQIAEQAGLKMSGSAKMPQPAGAANPNTAASTENTPATTRQLTRRNPGANKPDLPSAATAVETTHNENSPEPGSTTTAENQLPKAPEPAKTETGNSAAPTLLQLPQIPAARSFTSSPRLICLQTAPAQHRIIPFREKVSRWRAGVHFTALQANPGQTQSYRFAGAGLNVAYAPIRNLWLTTSIDQLSGSVTTDDKPPAWFFNGNTPKGGFFTKLTQIDANPQQLHLSLGLRYAVPVRFPLRPSIHLAHGWIRNDAGIYQFTFTNKFPNPNPNPWPWFKDKTEYRAERDAVRHINNMWQLGIGLEWETRNWVFQTRADWLEGSKANSPIFDAVAFRAGIQHKF